MKEDLRVYNPQGSDRRRAQLLMLYILNTVCRLFDEKKIPYWLSYGTALGAYRHGGFIPWDDDVDIAVPYKYKKQVCKILETELIEGLVLHSKDNDPNFPWPFIKVRDMDSIIHEPGTSHWKYQGIFIDIFFAKPTTSLTHKWRYALIRKKRNWQDSYLQTIRESYLDRLFYVRKILKLLGLLDKFLIKKYYYTEPFEQTLFVKKDIFPLGKIIFEGGEYNAPGNIKAYLKTCFDDFERIPEPSERHIHSCKFEFF